MKKIYFYPDAVDFRKGIEGLKSMCNEFQEENCYTGSMFVFRNASFSSIKILIHDGDGFWLCTKKLSDGTFNYWPGNQVHNHNELRRVLSSNFLNQGNILEHFSKI